MPSSEKEDVMSSEPLLDEKTACGESRDHNDRSAPMRHRRRVRHRAPYRALKDSEAITLRGLSEPLVMRYLPLGVAFFLLAAAFKFWFSLWPQSSRRSDGDHELVLPLWIPQQNVNPLYPLVVLSLLFAPAAIVLRRISREFGLLQPFLVASRQPITLAEVSALVDQGWDALPVLKRYAPFAGLVQLLLLVSSVAVVPLSALIVHPGTWTVWTWDNLRVAIGAPTGDALSSIIGTVQLPLSRNPGGIVDMAEKSLYGLIMGQRDVLHETPSPSLFPLLQGKDGKDAYIDQATYHGLLSFTWSSNCAYANRNFNPRDCNATASCPYVVYQNADASALEAGLQIASYAQRSPLALIFEPVNKTMFFMAKGKVPPSMISSATEVFIEDGNFFSRVACRPELQWRMSSCTWSAVAHDFVDCTDTTPDRRQNIDEAGLDALQGLLPLLLLDIHHRSDIHLHLAYGSLPSERALAFDSDGDQELHDIPSPAAYNSLFHDVAASLVRVATSGAYGSKGVSVNVPTTRAVWVARPGVLRALVWMLGLPVALCAVALWWDHLQGRPCRPAGFWEVVMAIRGQGWDESLLQGGLRDEQDARGKGENQPGKQGGMGNEPEHGRAPRGGELASARELLKKFGGMKVVFGVERDTGRVGLVDVERWENLDDPDLYL